MAASAARSESAGRAASMNWLPAKTGSPGFGDSLFASASAAVTLAGRSSRYLATMARASASVVGSGTVGPEPIAEGSSPGTSEIAMVTNFAGKAVRASLPPLMRERCLRTVLISPMFAPERSSARVTACLSGKVKPDAGAIQLAEAPPDISTSTRSSAPAPLASSIARVAASRPAPSGTGWPASIIVTFRSGLP